MSNADGPAPARPRLAPEARDGPPAPPADAPARAEADASARAEADGTAEAMSAVVEGAGLLAANRPVIVMLSGGRDSTALLDLAVRIAGRPAVGALHVNYGLRDAAGEDERCCRALCEELGVSLAVHRPATAARGNLQDWARRARYEAAAGLAQARGAEVAAGHTASDQVETILMRLASSPSRRALLGMRATERIRLNNGEAAVIRPLLCFTRAETTAYCVARRLRWREDATNESAAFVRNRARAGLVPALRELHPAAERNVLALAETLRLEGDVLDELVEAVLDGRAEIALARLREQPPAVRALIVQRLADGAAGGPAPGSARRAEDVAAMGASAALDLPSGVRALTRKGLLRFVRTPPQSPGGGARDQREGETPNPFGAP